MKILIREDKRDMLAKQILTDEFSDMYESVHYYTDSRGKITRIDYSNGDGIVMVYGVNDKVLYICEDVTQLLRMLSYTPKEVKDVVGEWFSEFFGVPVDYIHHVNKSTIN